MDIAEFLLARIAEDEAVALGVAEPLYSRQTFADRFMSWESDHTDGDSAHVERWNPARVIAECKAKRLMIEDAAQIAHDGDGEVGYDVGSLLIHMSRPYSDHPGYHWTWRETDDRNP